MLEITIRNRAGIHTRPVADLVKLCSKFPNNIYFKKGDYFCNGKSIIGMMSLAAAYKEKINVIAEGPNAIYVEQCLKNFIEYVIPKDEIIREIENTLLDCIYITNIDCFYALTINYFDELLLLYENDDHIINEILSTIYNKINLNKIKFIELEHALFSFFKEKRINSYMNLDNKSFNFSNLLKLLSKFLLDLNTFSKYSNSDIKNYIKENQQTLDSIYNIFCVLYSNDNFIFLIDYIMNKIYTIQDMNFIELEMKLIQFLTKNKENKK